MLLLWIQCNIYSTQKQNLIVMTQQTSCSGQLQRYEEELRHLEQELAGIQMVPGRTYDLRNRAVPQIVSNLSASASQSTWAQAFITSTPEQSCVDRKNHQTGTRENACKYDTEDRGCGTGWRSSLIGLTKRKEITGNVRVTGRKYGLLIVASCKATSHRQKGDILAGRGQWWGNGTR